MKPDIREERSIYLCFPSGEELLWESKNRIRDASYYEEEELILVIEEEDNNQWLVGLSITAAERFKVRPPAGWYMHYLSTHIKFSTAVVCVSDEERFDWFFGIDPKDGTWVSLNRAY